MPVRDAASQRRMKATVAMAPRQNFVLEMNANACDA
jgi:hypothetical protein